jgi:phage host-nuclease inhibitor protein Gam
MSEAHVVAAWIKFLSEKVTTMIQQVTDLQNDVNALQTSVNTLIFKFEGQANPADLQPIIAQVQALKTSVDNVVSPPAPVPSGSPAPSGQPA